ncbi:hypothetical protein Bca52824_069445 [Brassica carinata]|uniref:Uncharacterized protein n=1 Tax=Brassica carinata TaxID=52824 RepID=A0A8X7U2Y0_BRACI|nr:hypothetical protein Bca52824_069445 [Brassica carinata]
MFDSSKPIRRQGGSDGSPGVYSAEYEGNLSGVNKGIADCGCTLVRTEGVDARWKGLTPFAFRLT